MELDPVQVAAARVLHASWLACPDPVIADRLSSVMAVPGNVALRTRYEAIQASPRSGLPVGAFQLPWGVLLAQLSHTLEGDRQLSVNRPDLARDAFTELAALHVEGLHPQPLIDAETGLGDAARQADDLDGAIGHYERASSLARGIHHRYAQVRVAIPLGYLLMRVGSSARALEQLATARKYAHDADWRLDEANAVLGLGEAYARLRQSKLALAHDREALRLYNALRSEPGRANAYLQIAETCRRFGHPQFAREVYRRCLAACGDDGVAAANAWDGLAEVEITLGEPAAAYDHLLAALTTAGTGYPRGVAHALNGLARLYSDQEDWPTASDHYQAAAEAYEQLSDPVSAATSHAGLAACAERSGDVDTQLAERLAAVQCVERQRAAQIAHADQGEYFQRFGQFHEMALADGLLHGRLDVFLRVFEAVTGRRLSGLAQRAATTSTNARFTGQLAAGYRQTRPLQDHDPDEDPHRRVLSRLGRVALWTALPGLAGDALDRELAQVFVPFDAVDPGQLWDTIQKRGEPVLMLALLRRLATVAWLLVDPADPVPKFGLHGVSGDCLALVARLDRHGLPLDATPESLAALDELVPPPIFDHLPVGAAVTLVPADDLWVVPWPAAKQPGGRFLGETFALRRAPSLGILAAERIPGAPASVAWWRSPLVTNHQVPALQRTGGGTAVRPLPDAAAAYRAVLGGGDDCVVVVAHGKPAATMIHFIELDGNVRLVPADLLDAAPPPLLALITCWGATAPDRVAGDPLSVATLSLARGCQAVAATTSELRDDVPSSTFVNFFLDATLRIPMPQALLEATRRWLCREEYRNGYVSRWAPLTILAR